MISKTSAHKSPGSDGLTFEFYKCFWQKLSDIFLQMFQEVLKSSRLLTSLGNALIRLVPKTSSPESLGDYRPISLLNCDNKLMAGTIVNRLKFCLDKSFGPAQRGGIPGRRIMDNLTLYRDTITFLEEREDPER